MKWKNKIVKKKNILFEVINSKSMSLYVSYLQHAGILYTVYN